ncbi:MAG TPA: class I SAM-dependent methyltransferase [Egibacteraceae bacterium]|nr:class I SAM-dependent methyltransferase [Egibacteraceae bacterium]
MTHSLPLTGERTVPGIPHENYWFQRHVVAYRFARARIRGLAVMDAGCGEGYGAAMLADAASAVTGVELVPDVVAHAKAAYPPAAHPGLSFVEADLCRLPMPDASFDAVVSFQVIEHLPDVGGYLDEIRRVLKPGGEFLCATPNRLTFTPGSDTPVNPFHVKEFTAAELAECLGSRFRVKAVLGVHHGGRIKALERLARKPVTDLQFAAPPDEWPRWLRTAIAAVQPRDFTLKAADVDASLDLVAVAQRPPTPKARVEPAA